MGRICDIVLIVSMLGLELEHGASASSGPNHPLVQLLASSSSMSSKPNDPLAASILLSERSR